MADATIYYTSDGSAPTINSTKYTGPINLASSETVQAFATAPGYGDSIAASASYTIVPPPGAPTFSVPAGAYGSPQTVILSDPTPNVTIYYTTDGTTPNEFSKDYNAPIAVNQSETITAQAVISTQYSESGGVAMIGGAAVSPLATAAYTINVNPAATPTFSVSAGTYTSAQSVAITTATAGATIYYTVDGTTPTTGSIQYSSAISISTSETIQAIAVATGYANSAVASAAYVIDLPPPNFSLTSSASSLTVSSGQSGTLTISVAPSNGFNSPVSFACSGLPSVASCSFSPSTVTPSGAAASSTLTVTASATSAAVRSPSLFPGVVLSFTICCFGWKRRRRLQSTILLAIALAGLGVLEGCGGGSGSSGPPPPAPVTSTVTVTATSGTLQQTTTFSLTVN